MKGLGAIALSYQATGDIGDYTCYTRPGGRIVWYPKTPPQIDRSPLQTAWRAKLAEAASNWKIATEQARKSYEAITLKLSLPLTGYNLFISMSLRPQLEVLKTLCHQSGIEVEMPPALDLRLFP